jgi:hypothetical protein
VSIGGGPPNEVANGLRATFDPLAYVNCPTDYAENDGETSGQGAPIWGVVQRLVRIFLIYWGTGAGLITGAPGRKESFEFLVAAFPALVAVYTAIAVLRVAGQPLAQSRLVRACDRTTCFWFVLIWWRGVDLWELRHGAGNRPGIGTPLACLMSRS